MQRTKSVMVTNFSAIISNHYDESLSEEKIAMHQRNNLQLFVIICSLKQWTLDKSTGLIQHYVAMPI